MLDLLAYESILGGREIKMNQLIYNSSYEDPTAILKPTTDFIVFAERSGLVSAGLSAQLNLKLGKLT